jgi:hypothetical protein
MLLAIIDFLKMSDIKVFNIKIVSVSAYFPVPAGNHGRD